MFFKEKELQKETLAQKKKLKDQTRRGKKKNKGEKRSQRTAQKEKKGEEGVKTISPVTTISRGRQPHVGKGKKNKLRNVGRRRPD